MVNAFKKYFPNNRKRTSEEKVFNNKNKFIVFNS